MIVVRFRTKEDKKEMLHKVKKMYKFAKELKECLEDKMEDEDYDDEDEDDDIEYRHSEEYDEPRYRGGRQMRYRGRRNM